MNKDLLVRTISASLLLLFTIGIYTYTGTSGLLVLGLIVVIIGAYEYTNLFLKDDLALKILFLLTSVISIPLFYIYTVSPLVYISLFVITLGTFFCKRSANDFKEIHKSISILFLGYFYTIICPFFLFRILSIENTGLKLFFSVLLITFSSDVFAYVFGRAFGKSLLFPLISPKKTIAGAFGGLLAPSILSYAALFYFFDLSSPIYSVIIGLLCGVATQTGDFFASLLKRVAGVKDSGKIMPGHGGVLDRFDGLYFSGPVFYTLYYFQQL